MSNGEGEICGIKAIDISVGNCSITSTEKTVMHAQHFFHLKANIFRNTKLCKARLCMVFWVVTPCCSERV
jgi:hypothetical protein